MPIQRAAVLITCHNRRELTLASLGTLLRQRMIGDLDTEIFLVDDGCTDGTGQAVRKCFPSVHVLRGNGSLYWNGGMRLALAVAMQFGFDAYILMNDDVVLYPDALRRLVSLARMHVAASVPAIVVGSTYSRLTGEQSYGGLAWRYEGIRLKLRMIRAHPSQPVECDTMHANFVLIPKEVLVAIGGLDERFRHQFADLDLGLRAKAAGFAVIAMPGFAGDCPDNSLRGTWRDPKLNLSKRWRHLISPKGVPFPEWLRFTRRHYAWRWPAYVFSPYVKTLVTGLLTKLQTDAKLEPAMQESSCEN